VNVMHIHIAIESHRFSFFISPSKIYSSKYKLIQLYNIIVYEARLKVN